MNNEMQIETGFYYWYKHKAASQWNIGYVYETSDDVRMSLIDGGYVPIEQIDLEHFEFVKIEPPQGARNV